MFTMCANTTIEMSNFQFYGKQIMCSNQKMVFSAHSQPQLGTGAGQKAAKYGKGEVVSTLGSATSQKFLLLQCFDLQGLQQAHGCLTEKYY